jgi:hypothetical protein
MFSLLSKSFSHPVTHFYLINKIEIVQSEAARIATGGTKLTSIQKLCEETGWEKLLERREKHKLILPYYRLSLTYLIVYKPSYNVVNVIVPQPLVRK